jgi:selenocysteine lyase/cysteine desulfurase
LVDLFFGVVVHHADANHSIIRINSKRFNTSMCIEIPAAHSNTEEEVDQLLSALDEILERA